MHIQYVLNPLSENEDFDQTLSLSGCKWWLKFWTGMKRKENDWVQFCYFWLKAMRCLGVELRFSIRMSNASGRPVTCRVFYLKNTWWWLFILYFLRFVFFHVPLSYLSMYYPWILNPLVLKSKFLRVSWGESLRIKMISKNSSAYLLSFIVHLLSFFVNIYQLCTVLIKVTFSYHVLTFSDWYVSLLRFISGNL